ncbi:MAG: F-type H+-transporting ATPase subunit epsilon [Solirubrobacteraceae bacterium]|nr:F-type H+-transporting ATPase subunit epsilon [Solirubrobacteraceae bacterium]
MPKTQFHVEVLTPEGSVFDDDVEMVSTRTEVGSIGILARHQPLLGTLVPTELRLYRSDDDIVRYAQGEGYVQVSAEGVLVLVEEAHTKEQLDVADLKEKLRRAEEAQAGAEKGSEEQKRSARDARRWKAFLEMAEG